MGIQKGDPNWPDDLELDEYAAIDRCMEKYNKTRKQILTYLLWRGLEADKKEPYEN